MGTRRYFYRGLVLAGLLVVPLAAQSALLLRTIEGVDLYYDDVLDITWHGNANLAATETFGLTQSTDLIPVAGAVGSTGRMFWSTANAWIAGMNAANYLGFSDWMLPILSPLNGSAFDMSFSNNATTDQGYAYTGAGGGWRDNSGDPVSQMGHMYYVNLGNLGRCTPNDLNPGGCDFESDYGLANTGDFSNLQPFDYWSGVESSANFAKHFRFHSGHQFQGSKDLSMFVWAVRPGDVAAQAVPAPGTLTLFGAGLLGLLGLRRARRR